MNIRLMSWILVFLCSGMLYGQTQEKTTSIWDQSTSKSGLSDQKGKDEPSQKMAGIPMEGSVDPNQYILGPSDAFALTFWGSPPLEYTILVTPEGTLLIPTVGEIRVADLSLALAKKRVAEAVEKKYRPGSFSMTLIRPRSMLVSIRGAVSRPGQYLASPVERVEKILIAAALDVKSPNTTFTIPAFSAVGTPVAAEDIRVPKVTTITELADRSSTRNIKLIRRNGDTIHVDILKYYATLDNKYNPFLVDGDLIVVPTKALTPNSISIHGAVNAPGRYEFVQGDSLSGFIRLAQGLLEVADPGKVTIYRSEQSSERSQEISVNLDAVMNGTAPDIALQRGDRVLVKYQVDKRKDFYVTVGGEVASPGEYPITRESTKLSDIIRAAGGVTNRALLTSSVVWRKYDKINLPEVAQQDYLTTLRAHQFGLVDSNYFFSDQKMGRQPVVVDLKKLIVDRDTSGDVTLRHEDVVYIASNERSVLVQGQVGNPGYVAYVPGANYRYYVHKAGDYQEFADEGEVRVIKGGTMSWYKPGDTEIESGDRIWVPKEPRKGFAFYYTYARDVVSIVISAATLIFAIRASR